MQIETVVIKGPGGTARIPKSELDTYLKKDGYELIDGDISPSTSSSDDGDSGDGTVEINAHDIRQMSGKELEAFVVEHELQTNLDDHSNLKSKKTAVISELGLEE